MDVVLRFLRQVRDEPVVSIDCPIAQSARMEASKLLVGEETEAFRDFSHRLVAALSSFLKSKEKVS